MPFKQTYLHLISRGKKSTLSPTSCTALTFVTAVTGHSPATPPAQSSSEAQENELLRGQSIFLGRSLRFFCFVLFNCTSMLYHKHSLLWKLEHRTPKDSSCQQLFSFMEKNTPQNSFSLPTSLFLAWQL